MYLEKNTVYRYFLSSCVINNLSQEQRKECGWAGYPLIIYFVLCHSREKSSAWFAARSPNPVRSTPWPAGHRSAREGPPICFPRYQVGKPEAPASREVRECGFPGSHVPLLVLMKEMHSHCVLKDNSHSQEPQILLTPNYRYLLLSCGDISTFLSTSTQNVMAIIKILLSFSSIYVSRSQ